MFVPHVYKQTSKKKKTESKKNYSKSKPDKSWRKSFDNFGKIYIFFSIPVVCEKLNMIAFVLISWNKKNTFELYDVAILNFFGTFCLFNFGYH